MKIIITIIAITLTVAATVNAAEIPLESVPCNATDESIVFTEKLISDILTEVQNGLGYADARNEANSRIFSAVISNQSNGYGYGLLSPIACNAIFQYRDMYLRPEYYAEKEIHVGNLISDIAANYKNGVIDYKTAEKQFYIRILQSINPSFEPASCVGDFCYWDVPPFDQCVVYDCKEILVERIELDMCHCSLNIAMALTYV